MIRKLDHFPDVKKKEDNMKARMETPRTRVKEVKGIVFYEGKMMFAPVEVRVTADQHGKSMSLVADGVMIEIPMEAVADMLEVK